MAASLNARRAIQPRHPQRTRTSTRRNVSPPSVTGAIAWWSRTAGHDKEVGMRFVRSRMLGLAALMSLLALPALPGVASGATVANGGFGAGSFAGWSVANQAGGSGDWFVYTGTSTPLNGFPVAAPPEGTHAAVTDQGGPGSHVLYQDVA